MQTNQQSQTNIFCVVGEPILFEEKGDRLIECNIPGIAKRRGITAACVSLSHPCYNASYKAYKKLLQDGFKEVTQADYCKFYNL